MIALEEENVLGFVGHGAPETPPGLRLLCLVRSFRGMIDGGGAGRGGCSIIGQSCTVGWDRTA